MAASRLSLMCVCRSTIPFNNCVYIMCGYVFLVAGSGVGDIFIVAPVFVVVQCKMLMLLCCMKIYFSFVVVVVIVSVHFIVITVKSISA